MIDLVQHYNAYPIEYTSAVCFIMVLVSMALLLCKGEKAAAVPGLAISGGIFFTFLGLALSLHSVSGSGVDTQFSTLLNGLSTAFWTSVAGMGISIFARFALVLRKASNPLTEVKQEMDYVREQIKGVGEDIGKQFSSAMTHVINDYRQAATEHLEATSNHIEIMNARFLEGITHVETSYARLQEQLEGMAQESQTIVDATHQLAEKTRVLLKENKGLYEQQAQWVNSIQECMGSIAVLAPEAKTVFQAIEAFNQDYLSSIAKLEERVQKNQDIFVTDIDEHTVKVIQRIAAFDDEYHRKVAEYLSQMDESVKKSFDTIINYFGGGMSSLAEKQLMVVAETVEQIHQAKREMMKTLNLSEQSMAESATSINSSMETA